MTATAELSDDQQIALDQLKNEFECQLCSNTVVFPVQVQCGHLFCAPCLKKKPVKQNLVICPICKTKFNRRIQKPRQDFQDLLHAFNNLLTEFQSSKPTTSSTLEIDQGERTEVLTIREGADRNATTVVCSSDLNCSGERNELFVLTQAVTLKVPNTSKVKVVALEVQSVTTNVQKVVENSAPKKILEYTVPDPGSNEDCPKPLDLTKKLSSQEMRAIKRPRYAFPSVDPSVALDLSGKSNRQTKTSNSSGDCFKSVNTSHAQKKPILNPVRYYHIYDLPDATNRSRSLENSRMTCKSMVVEKPASQKSLASLRNSTSAHASESSDRILCKAFDILISQEVEPANSDNFMPSGDDAILNAAVDVADVFTSSSIRSNSGKRCNDVDEESISDSIEKRLKMMEDQGNVNLMDVADENNQNNQDQVNPDDSDNGSEDMFYPQTPTSQKESHTKSNAPELLPAQQIPNASNQLKVLNPSKSPKTPMNVSVFCTSPPSGALSTVNTNANIDNYDPFADDLGEIPDSQVRLAPTTPMKPERSQVEAKCTTPNTGSKFGKKNSEGNLKDYSTPKQWTSPSQQNYKSPSRSFLGRNQKDQYYLAALSPQAPPKVAKNYVFCPTRLSSIQINQLRLLCGMCGGKIAREFSDEVTHLILTLEDGRVPQTMKYLFAIAGKKWVLTFDWVEECLKQKKIVREELHETSNFKGGDIGVRESRLADVPLFRSFSFHVLGDFRSSGARDSDWRRLLKKLGATIISDVSNATTGTIIVGDSSDSSVDYQKLFKERQVVTVAWEWILDCVLNYSVLPISKTEYLVTRIHADELRAVGLPPELLPESY